MMLELAENEPDHRILPWIRNYTISRECVIAFGCRKGITGKLVFPCSELYFVFEQIYSILGIKSLIYLYCGLRLEWQNATMTGQSYVMFGWSWTEVSVLSSQVFGQASLEGCAMQPSATQKFQI